MEKLGRPEKTEYEKMQDSKAKKRFGEVLEFVKDKRGLSNRKVAELMGITPSQISRLKNDPDETISPRTAQLLCNVINKYPNESPIHAGSDFRWEWVAGREDQDPTYYEKNYNGYLNDVENAGDPYEISKLNAAKYLIAHLFDLEGYKLNELHLSSIIPEAVSGYQVMDDEQVLFSFSVKEFQTLEDDICKFGSILIEREIKRRYKKTPGTE